MGVDKTALYMASEKRDFEIVKLLLNREDLDINYPSKSSTFNKTIIEDDEKTALQIAVEREYTDIVNLLMENEKLDVNLSYEKSESRTALHIAVIKQNKQIINILLKQKGIDINALDVKGRTPMDLTDNKEIISLFQSYRSSKLNVLETSLIDELLNKKSLLGKGATSTVYKVLNCLTHKGFLCLKILNNEFFGREEKNTKKKSIWSEEEEDDDLLEEDEKEEQIDIEKAKQLYLEYELLSNLNHPKIVKVFGFYFGDENHNPAILLEYCKFNIQFKKSCFNAFIEHLSISTLLEHLGLD